MPPPLRTQTQLVINPETAAANDMADTPPMELVTDPETGQVYRRTGEGKMGHSEFAPEKKAGPPDMVGTDPALFKHYRALQRAQAAAAAGDPRAPLAVAAIQGEIKKYGAASQDYDRNNAQAELGRGGRTLAGAGAGMLGVGRNVATFMGQGGKLAPADDFNRDKGLVQRGSGGTSGVLLGEMAATAPLGVLGKAGRATTFWSKLAQGGAEGAAGGLLTSEEGHRGQAALLGALGGAGTAAIGAGGSAAANGVVTPDARARFLRGHGVPLTTAQMDPTTKLAKLEQGFTNHPTWGPAIEGNRQRAQNAAEAAAFNQGMAPGGTPITAGQMGPGQRPGVMDQLYGEYDAAYKPARNQQVFPAVMDPKSPSRFPVSPPVNVGTKKAPAMQHAMPGYPLQSEANGGTRGLVDQGIETSTPTALPGPQDRSAVQQFTNNQLGKLPGGVDRPAALSTIPSDTLLNIRQNIRSAIRANGSNPNKLPHVQLLQEVEGHLTDALTSQLTPKRIKALEAADAAYRQFKTLEGAVVESGGKDKTSFWSKLGDQVRQNTPGPLYARGEGGPLRDFAEAGVNNLDNTIPMTGARSAITGGLPGVRFLKGATAAAVSDPKVATLLAGQTRPQQWLADALRNVGDRTSRNINVAAGEAAAER